MRNTRGCTQKKYGWRLHEDTTADGWRRESKKFLQLHPLCEECLRHGIATLATVVDHIVPHRGDPKLFWDRSNWQVLCKRCHDRKTGRDDSHPVYLY